MRYSLQYYLGSIPVEEMQASPAFSFVVSATLSLQGGPIFIAAFEDLSPLVMEIEDMDPLEILTMDISPLVMEE